MCAHPLAQVDRDQLDDHDLTAEADCIGQGPHALHIEEAVAT